MRWLSSAPMPAIGSSSSSRLGLAGQRHGDLELALLAVAEGGGRRVGARVEADAARPLARRLAQARVAARVGQEAEGMAGDAPARRAPRCRAR